jgi:hypothetical protein
MSFFDSHHGLFVLILPYFAFILSFYFPFSHFLSPFFPFLSPFFPFLLHFPPFFFLAFSYFFPQITSADIPPRGGGGNFPKTFEGWLKRTIFLNTLQIKNYQKGKKFYWLQKGENIWR